MLPIPYQNNQGKGKTKVQEHHDLGFLGRNVLNMNSDNLTSQGEKEIPETLVLVFTLFMAGKGSQEKFFAIPFKPDLNQPII